MLLCTPDNLADYLLAAFLAAAEGQNPGLAERQIEAVSGEILNLLTPRYPLPWPETPSVVRYIAAVFASYRTAGAITTLVNTEGQTENEWIPLQKEYKRADALLKDIATGKIKLALDEVALGEFEEPSIAVVSPGPYFDLRKF
jgi:phage gp36-like protein